MGEEPKEPDRKQQQPVPPRADAAKERSLRDRLAHGMSGGGAKLYLAYLRRFHKGG